MGQEILPTSRNRIKKKKESFIELKEKTNVSFSVSLSSLLSFLPYSLSPSFLPFFSVGISFLSPQNLKGFLLYFYHLYWARIQGQMLDFSQLRDKWRQWITSELSRNARNEPLTCHFTSQCNTLFLFYLHIFKCIFTHNVRWY